MDGADKDLGWEMTSRPDAGTQNPPSLSFSPGVVTGHMGSSEATAGISDAVTSAMVNHFARELTQGSMSLWPQVMVTARRYFNVTHGYVLRKALWQLLPLASVKKKSTEGELGGDKEWTTRIFEGLEVDIEEPDMYIPTMGFVTYVLLCGLVRGLQEQFQPDVLSATMSFAVVALIVETAIAKAVLVMAGAFHAPAMDLAALLGYKYFYLSLQLLTGLVLGFGRRPEGVLYHLLTLGLSVSCGVALWQSLRRLARMQPAHGQECVADVHKVFIKALPALQLLFCWFLLPSWPKRAAVKEVVSAAASAVVSTVLETAPNATLAEAVAAVAAGGAS